MSGDAGILLFVLLGMLAMVIAAAVLEAIAPDGPPAWLERLLRL